jgi:KDO2-lipid IV(A) lauroyltransferase
VTLENIERALGDRLGRKRRVAVGRRSYVNFAKSMVEFASLGRLREAQLRSLVAFHGSENVERAFSGGKGIVCVTGHFGSWELLGAATVANGIPVDFLVGEQTNSAVDALMNDIRRSAGIGTIARGIAARGVFGSLKKNRLVALLSDQDARGMGIFVNFFGIPASTYPGAAQFAVRMNCPIVFVAIIRNDDDTHEAHFLPPEYPRAAAAREDEVFRLTQRHAAILEEFVTRHPEQYFWAHRRWKTRPPAEASVPPR